MNVENLRNNYPKLISYMKTAGYSDDYTNRVQREIQWILAETGNNDWNCYSDVYQYHKTRPLSTGYLGKKRSIISIIHEFDLHGRYPDGKRSELVVEGSYQKLVPEFRSLIDYYSAEVRENGKKESSINTESKNVSAFLFTMQNAGINRLIDITEEAVMPVFVSADGKKLKSHSYRKFVSSVLKTCIPLNPNAIRKILSFIPFMKRGRKNIQYLTSQEAQAILFTMEDMSNSLTLRERAIGKLAYYTGLRSCDIASMEFHSIDWECDLIRIRQQKTEELQELPLTATVGNAIYDYITNERPPSDCPNLFLAQYAPYRKMERHGIWGIAAKIMKEAGIRQSKGDRRGFHLFRHHLVTTLLGNGTSQAVISSALGHAAPESLEDYISADFTHLKECALSIAPFPVSEGVFIDA